MRLIRIALLVAGFAAGSRVTPVQAQGSLAAAAERARRAWQSHQPEDLIGRSGKVTVSLPATAPSDALEPAQATALLKDVFDKATELETVIRAVRSTAPDAGYVELRRRFRLVGTQEVGQQTILLSYRRVGAVWFLGEVRVLD